MSRYSNDVADALEQAARVADEAGFDAALDHLLAQARVEATPDRGFRAMVDARLLDELVASTGASGTPRSGGKRLTAARVSGVRPVAPRTTGWLRAARGLGLVGVGVALGFVWGRAPRALPGELVTPPRRTEQTSEASQAAPRAILELAPVERLELPSTAAPRPSQSAESAAQTQTTPAPSRADDASSRPRAASADASTRKRAGAHEIRELPAGADSLRFVLEQLRKAQLFLRAGEPARAIATLDLLDARVPGPMLQEEREVTRTFALCDAGETALAASLAARILARSPDSAYAVSVRDSCAGKAKLLEELRERTSNPRR